MTERTRMGKVLETWRRTARDAAEDVLRCADDAEDVAQQVLIRAWRSGRWRRLEHPKVYFNTAARREALTMLRNRRRRRDRRERAEPSLVMAARPLRPDEQVVSDEVRRRWMEAIGTLPTRCERVCSLVFLEGYTQAEVASRLRVGRKAVEKQVARGRAHLRKRLTSGNDIEL